jgi:microbial collagenase
LNVENRQDLARTVSRVFAAWRHFVLHGRNNVGEIIMHSFKGLAAGVCLLSSLACGVAIAGPENRSASVRPARAAAPAEHRIADVPHIQSNALTPDQIPPLPSTRDHLYRSYDDPAPARARDANRACDLNQFATSSGSALVTAVRNAELTTCLYDLFDVTGTQAAQIFTEAKMITIADAMRIDSATYPGTNAGRMLQLVIFLRAGYYVEYVDPSNVGPFSSQLDTAARAALDAFFANSHIADVNQVHGQTLSEVVTLIDSSDTNAHQLGNALAVIQRYGPSYQAHSYMRSAVNNAFSVLYSGHFLNDFITEVQAQGVTVSDTLRAFIVNNRAADVGTSRQYLLQNAAGELGRLLKYPSLLTMLRPKVKSTLDLFQLGAPGDGVYMRLASMVMYYDAANCAYYGLCNFDDEVAALILPAANARDCSMTLRVRSQALTSSQLDTVCSIVGGEESFFHTLSNTSGVPVANDYNARLEMVIFHSSTDYETYSGIIFGNDTNNGGVYLEGDPSNPQNQARFLAYEAEWLRPTFEVWNLTHEYIHYLDGRFNWHGGFNVLPQQAPYSAIWYVEGFAEYASWSYRNLIDASAVAQAAHPDTFRLDELFNTVYTTDYTRTYQWGHLATRFMFERHRDLIDSLYAVARVGNYNPGYRNWLNPIRSEFNDEFRAWVQCFADNNGDTSACSTFTPDRIFGDGFDTPPPEQPDPAPECSEVSPTMILDNGCKHSGLSADSANQSHYLRTPFIPAGTATLRFEMSRGTGDADLYVRYTNWPTATEFDFAPRLDGNNETVVINNPAAGYYTVMIKPKTGWFDGVQIKAIWQ